MMIMDGEREKKLEVLVACCKILLLVLSSGTEEDHNEPQNSQSAGRDPNDRFIYLFIYLFI